MNDLQDELLSGLSADIQADIINVSQSDADVFSHLSAKFPVRASGITWELVPEHRCKQSPRPKPSIEDYLHSISAFLGQFAEAAQIAPDDNVWLVGDGITDVAFRLSFTILLKHVRQFFSMPQSSFVLKHDYSWCFCYTFEDDMYYGKSPL
jgi:hypothetical protein